MRYKGKKLEIFKTKYLKKRSLDQNKENEVTDGWLFFTSYLCGFLQIVLMPVMLSYRKNS